MKFLAAFFITIVFLLGVMPLEVPMRSYSHDLIPSKIVDKKKIAPLKVPYTDCIVSDGGSNHTLEEHVEVCLAKRDWLEISIDDRKGKTTI